MLERPVRIAVIDSGIKSTVSENIKLYITIKTEKEGEFHVYEGAEDILGHGTAITSIIQKAKVPIEIYSLKIFDEEENISYNILYSALIYIKNNLQIDIIHMSLGVTLCDEKNKFYSLCKELSNKGVILISAYDNNGTISYPAAFDCVIGVYSGTTCRNINDFEYVDDDIINIGAKGSLQRVAWTTPEYLMMKGNSFAAAHVTRKVAELIYEGYITRKNILSHFKKNAKKYYKTSVPVKKDNLFPINKAILFPFNKEMHSLIRYRDMLDFEIIDIYDIKYSGRVGSTTAHIMKEPKIPSYNIKEIKNISWDQFDTLILGHLEELSLLVNINNFKSELIEQAILHDKNIYSFDPVSENYRKLENIYFPQVNVSDLQPFRFGMLYQIAVPVIGIFGTSSQQGKFTLQLYLRDRFMKDKYQIGQIGTEPSSLLYGMDYVFPIGYNNTVQIKEEDIIRYLNYCMNSICEKGAEIILVGSQSGTIPYHFGNLINFTILQYLFLMGTVPDVVILCINPYDEIEYIKRTVDFLEASVNCKVISLVMFPMNIRDDWAGIYGEKVKLSDKDFLSIRNTIEKIINRPIYQLGNKEHMELLYHNLLDYF